MTRQFLAICRDGLRESLDKRSLLVLAFIGLACVAFCFGVSFEVLTLVEALDRNASEIGTFRSRTPGQGHFTSSMHAEYTVAQARAATESDALPPDFPPSASAVVEVALEEPHSLDALMTSWRWFVHRRKTGENLDPPSPAPLYGEADRADFLRERFLDFGYADVFVRPAPGENPSYLVAARADRIDEVEGASTMKILFGAYSFPLLEASLAETVLGIQTTLVNTLVGFIGMLILLSACSGFVPDMMQKGTIDLVLARPIPRVRLLLFKYFAAVLFVFLLTTLIVAGCALGLFAGTGLFNPWFLFCSVSATTVFAVLYSASILIGVLTRSGNLAALGAAGIWGAASIVGQMRQLAKMGMIFDDAPTVRAWLEGAYLVLPKVADVATANVRLLSARQLSPEAHRRLFESAHLDVAWATSAGTTAAFLVACLSLAAWLFRRRDF